MRGIVGMTQLSDMHRLDLVLGPAEEPAPGRIHAQKIAGEIRYAEQILGDVPDAVAFRRPPFDFLLELFAEFAQLAFDAVALMFGPLARSDVTGDLRGADDSTVRVLDRRDAQRNRDLAAVLALADRLVVIEAGAAPDALEDFRLLVPQLRRNEDRDRLANDFFGRVAEQVFGGAVPADDDAVEGLADDGVAGRFDDAGELLARLHGAALLGDVEERRDPAVDFARGIGFRPVGGVQAARPGYWKVDLAIEFRRFAAQHFFDVRPQRVETLVADRFGDGLADDLFAPNADQLRVGLADETVVQVPAAAPQHERRAVDDRLQFGLAGAQRFLDALALGQGLKAAHRAFNAARFALQRRDVHQHRHQRPVGLFDDDLGADDRLAGAQHVGDRRRGKGQGGAVGLIAPEAGTMLLVRIAERERPAPQLDGAAVVANERAFGRAHAKPRRNGIQRGLIEIDKHVDAGRDGGGLSALTTTHYGFPHSTERGSGCQVPLGSVFFPFHWHGAAGGGFLRVNSRHMKFTQRRSQRREAGERSREIPSAATAAARLN